MTTVRSLSLVAVAALVAGCADGSTETAELLSVARDSAGITIVDNQAPDPESRLDWQISPEPELSIGTLEGEEPYQLFRVRAATKLADGRLLVANGGSNEIRVFDASGTHLESWGREGEGPGEFLSLSSVDSWTGDSIGAWDFRQRRVSVFTSAGELARTITLAQTEEMAAPQFNGLLPDGTILSMGGAIFTAGQSPLGFSRPDRPFARLSSEGDFLESLGNHPGSEAVISGGDSFMMVMTHPFGRATRTIIWGDRILISPNDTYELRGFDLLGNVTHLLRREHAAIAVTQTHMDEWVAQQLAEQEEEDDESEIFQDMYEDFPTVESFPAFSSLKVDALGNLWVEEYALPGDETTVWTVFDPAGQVLGLVETPPDLNIYEIGEDYILGSWTDDLDIEYVQMWGLRRSTQ